MKINYNNNGNFNWDKESAQKELLEYMLQEYLANEPDNASLIANALKPEKMEENNNQSSRKFGRVTYGNILTQGFNSLKTIKVSEIDEITSLSKETRRLLLVVDEDLTLKQLTDEKTRAKVLGITGNVRSLENKKLGDKDTPKDYFVYGPRTKKELKLGSGKQLMNDILEGEGVSEANKPIPDTKTTKKKATWKSWTLDEDKFKVNNPYDTGSQITIQELKVATLKDMGYSQINFTPTYTRSKTSSRRKGDFKQIDRPKKLGPDRNLLESKTGTQPQKEAALRDWESKPYMGNDKQQNGIVLRRFSAQIKVAINLQIILQELTEYESIGIDEEGKAIETDEDEKTGRVELIDWSEKVDAKTNEAKPHKLMVAFSNLKDQKINEDSNKLKEVSEEYKKLLEIDAKIDNLYDAKINLDKPKENKELTEVVELFRNQDIQRSPNLKRAFKLKSEDLLDLAFKEMDEKFEIRLDSVEKRYKSYLEALETRLKNYISKYKKEEKKLINDKKEHGDAAVSSEESEEFKESNLKRFKTNKTAKSIYEDMEDFVKKFFKENVENLFKVFSYSIQVEKIEATKIVEGKPKTNTTFKVKVIEAREITTITVSKGITQQDKKEGRSRTIVKPMSENDKRDLSLFFKLLQKRYRKLNNIIQ